MNFAENLQKLRKKAGLSQENIADHLNISRQAVSKWEMGQSTPDIETCMKLCELLNATPNQLLFDSEPEKAPQEKGGKIGTFFVGSVIFLTMVCACGTILLVCNMYNGEIFEPSVHLQALLMTWGSLAAFIVISAYCLWKSHSAGKRQRP